MGEGGNKRLKRNEVKPSLFADNIILYVDNPKKSTKKLLELINELIKVARGKANIQKQIFLYSTTEKTKNEIKKIILVLSR